MIGSVPFEVVPSLEIILKRVPEEEVMVCVVVGYPDAEDVIDESFVN